MTVVTVQSGACGFTTTITVEKTEDGNLSVTLDSQCDMVQNMSGDVAILDRFAPLTGFKKNAVYEAAARNLKHVACPVPAAILKALEVEAGLNVAKDVTIHFAKKERETSR